MDPLNSTARGEIKRLASLKKQKELFKAREEVIRNALRNVDRIDPSGKQSNSISSKIDLFDEDDDEQDEEEVDFTVKEKPKYQTFGGDARFQIDTKILENDEPVVQEPIDADELEQERRHQLDILENVLGKPIRKLSDKSASKIKKQYPMIHYDPNEIDHRKHELVQEDPTEPRKKKKKKSEPIEAEEPLPVNNEVFYSFSTSLTEALKEQEGFSFIKSFGSPEVKDNKDQNNTTSKFDYHIPDMNPLIEDEEDNENELPVPAEKIEEEKFQIDKFFFSSNDPRFSDAIDFFKCPSESEPFADTRRELKKIVRSKIRNNKRKCVS